MFRPLLITLLGLTLPAPAFAENVKIDQPWVRATAPGQKVAGGFMTLTADADMKLMGGSSPVSRHFELHTMKMEKGVMEMRQVPEIALPKGQAVKLAPGGLHVMFIDLNGPIKPGQKVPLTLELKGADGKIQTVKLEAEARAMGGHHH